MEFKHQLIIALSILILGCSSQKKFKNDSTDDRLSQPAEASIILDSSLIIPKFNRDNIEVLKQYLAGNSRRWDVRSERRLEVRGRRGRYYEVVYAIKKDEAPLHKGGFNSNSGVYNTRTIISFGNYYRRESNTDHITYVSPKEQVINTVIQTGVRMKKGNSSCLVLKDKLLDIQIAERAEQLERKFTIQTMRELKEEFSMVLENSESIVKTGRLPLNSFYDTPLDSNYFDIGDSTQKGIYVAKAGLCLKEKGVVYMKVFNATTGVQLSEGRITARSKRIIGWSAIGRVIFPYESEFTVFEGDWSSQYKARFEIWFQPDSGEEVKLAEKEQDIYGWER